MAEFLIAAAAFVLAMIAIGLLRIARRPAGADHMMAVQLIGTGGTAVLLLFAVAGDTPPIIDVTLMMALLATFATVAFVRDAHSPDAEEAEAPDERRT